MKIITMILALALVASPAVATMHDVMVDAGVGADVDAEAKGSVDAQANTSVRTEANAKGGEREEYTNEDIKTGARATAKADAGLAAIRMNANAQAPIEEITTTIEAQGEARVEMSNGAQARVMVMPEVAAQTAIDQLRLHVCSEENNCTIELRASGEGNASNETRAEYEVRANKEARIFGFFRVDMPVQARVDAETGAVVESNKPWWAFLAAEGRAEARTDAQAEVNAEARAEAQANN